jgi:hypothetical protein
MDNIVMNTDLDPIDAKLQDIPALEIVFERATRNAIRRHALIGNEIVFWSAGQIIAEVPKLEDYPPLDDTP